MSTKTVASEHIPELIKQGLSDRVANTQTVLTLRQVGKNIISGINALNSFNLFLTKHEFGSSYKNGKQYPKLAGLVQYQVIS
ncbi:hypothetical protein [Coleofasciculus sp. G2-EDA-02]|uniref:hypothetical protein n=1 Tax=Coleofasciculus sp. G2-EDA-02 TaxID=3069529 RepID=UPI0032F53CAE